MNIPTLKNPKNHPLILFKNLKFFVKVLDNAPLLSDSSEILQLKIKMEEMANRLFDDYMDVTK